MFMLHDRLAAKPGKRDDLLAILAEGDDAELLPGCRLYLVAVDETDPDGFRRQQLDARAGVSG